MPLRALDGQSAESDFVLFSAATSVAGHSAWILADVGDHSILVRQILHDRSEVNVGRSAVLRGYITLVGDNLAADRPKGETIDHLIYDVCLSARSRGFID